jgi:hypothetical protein
MKRKEWHRNNEELILTLSPEPAMLDSLNLISSLFLDSCPFSTEFLVSLALCKELKNYTGLK